MEIAKYLGYPDCCMEAFCNLMDIQELTVEQKSIWQKPEWFLTCKEHAEKIALHEISISDLLVTRHPELPPFGALDHDEAKRIIVKIKERENLEPL